MVKDKEIITWDHPRCLGTLIVGLVSRCLDPLLSGHCQLRETDSVATGATTIQAIWSKLERLHRILFVARIVTHPLSKYRYNYFIATDHYYELFRVPIHSFLFSLHYQRT